MAAASLPEQISASLNYAINHIVENKQKYVSDPDRDFTRNRKLTMGDTVKLLLSMEGGSLNKELYKYYEVSNTRVTASAFVQQRNKISPYAFKEIFRLFNNECYDSKTYHGWHIYAADGSDINMFRNPDSATFITTEQYPYGYNQMHLNALYDICNRTYADAVVQPRPRMDERSALITMLKRNIFRGKNIIIVDRGYESYNMFAHFLNTDNVEFVCRVKQGAGALKEVSKLPMQELDRNVTVEITTTQTNEDKRHQRRFIQTGSKKGKVNNPKTRIGSWDFESPYTLNFRVVRFMLSTGEYETIVTSLPRSVFPMKNIKEIYHMRWGIETSFRELKYIIGLVNLHGKKDEFVEQEIYAALTMYNFCERIAGAIVVRKSKKNVYAYQLNFTMAISLCRSFYKSQRKDGDRLMDDISRYTEPIRPDRMDKRKMRPKGFVGFTYRIAA